MFAAQRSKYRCSDVVKTVCLIQPNIHNGSDQAFVPFKMHADVVAEPSRTTPRRFRFYAFHKCRKSPPDSPEALLLADRLYEVKEP